MSFENIQLEPRSSMVICVAKPVRHPSTYRCVRRAPRYLLAATLALLAVPIFGITLASDSGMDERCTQDRSVCLKSSGKALELPNIKGERTEYQGQTYAVAWGDANQNEWPDIYLNHHGWRNLNGRFPGSHLILDPGMDGRDWDYRTLEGGDQHSAVFLDVDGDGVQDILERVGGARGTALARERKNWNRLYLSARQSAADPSRVARSKGLADPAGRGISTVPMVLDGRLILAFINAPRDDGVAPSSFLARDTEAFRRVQPKLACDSKPAACPRVPIDRYRRLSWGHLGPDDFPDLVLHSRFKRFKADSYLILRGLGDLTFSKDNSAVLEFPPQHALLADVFGRGRFDLILASQQKFTLLSPGVLGSGWVTQPVIELQPLFESPQKLKDIGALDLNNDGVLEIVTFHSTATDGNHVAVWVSDRIGAFKPTTFKLDELGCHAKSMAFADFNLDGAMDIVFASGDGIPYPDCKGGYAFWLGVPGGNWLQIDLVEESGLSGLGARVYVSTDSREVVRGQYGGVRGLAQDHVRLHIGLSSSDVAVIKVVWSDGSVTLKDVDVVNQIVSIHRDDTGGGGQEAEASEAGAGG